MEDDSSLSELRLHYNGETFMVKVDVETRNELLEDEQKLSIYSKHIYNMFHPPNCPKIFEGRDVPGPSSSVTTKHEEKENKQENFKWTHDLTLLLIELRLKKENEFNRPVCKKKKLWTSIGNEISMISNYNITGDMCDIKYRNLLSTYKSNKKRAQQSGESAISWEYFELFDKVLGTKASIVPSVEVLGSVDSISVVDEGVENITRNKEDMESDSGSSTEAKTKKTVKKRKTTVNIEEYLYEKQKADVERRLAKEKKEEERWIEKKAIKEREIQAIEKLAEAIAGQYKK